MLPEFGALHLLHTREKYLLEPLDGLIILQKTINQQPPIHFVKFYKMGKLNITGFIGN